MATNKNDLQGSMEYEEEILNEELANNDIIEEIRLRFRHEFFPDITGKPTFSKIGKFGLKVRTSKVDLFKVEEFILKELKRLIK